MSTLSKENNQDVEDYESFQTSNCNIGKFSVNKVGSFYYSDTTRLMPQELDFVKEGTINIRSLNLLLGDFENYKINRHGFKSVFTSDSSENPEYQIWLTATGKLFGIHNGLPSYVGMPSTIIPLSGLSISDKGQLKIPKITSFKMVEFKKLVQLAALESFHRVMENHAEISDIVHHITFLNNGTELFVPNYEGIENKDLLYLDKYPSYYLGNVNLEDGTHWVSELPKE